MPLVNLCRYLCPEVGGFTATGDKSNPAQKVIANVTLYHANQNVTDTSFAPNLLARYCWLGVGARVDLKSMNLSNTGNYDLTIAANTQ